MGNFCLLLQGSLYAFVVKLQTKTLVIKLGHSGHLLICHGEKVLVTSQWRHRLIIRVCWRKQNHNFHWWISGLWCVMILLLRIQRQKSDFQIASQSEIALKMANRSKYDNFNSNFWQWMLIRNIITHHNPLIHQW